ncbi:Clp protease N-terminal domain-containing protein [Nonomuraea sp. CA-218870]|uniref:Clp protease N-terminal domain-containing protein n=1 Tax=Nonomuraea sp. CA-218870 TaxID=3239998 RepID=UPI003D8AF994
MPKINVYLPDDLAEAVKQAGVPVSAVCQRALEQAVRRVTAIRETALSDLDLDRPAGALTLLTPRTRTALKLASARAGAGPLETAHLLAGMLEEGTNLALHVMRAMDIDPARVGRELAVRLSQQTPGSQDNGVPSGDHDAPDGGDLSGRGPEDGPAGEAGGGSVAAGARRFGVGAANALEFAVNEATSLGHNYVGCEHLLLGLVAEPEGIAGQVLRGLGAEPRPTRRAVVAALAGYVHLRAESGHHTPAQSAGQGTDGTSAQPAGEGAGRLAGPGADPVAVLTAVLREQLQPVVQRVARLEEHLGLGSGD